MYAFSVLVLSLTFLAVAEVDGFYVKPIGNSDDPLDSDELPPVFALIDVAKPASNAYLTNMKTQLKRLAATLSPQQKLGIGTYSGSDQNPYVKEVVSLTMVSDKNVNWNSSIDSLQLSQSGFRDVGAALRDVASILAPFKNVGSVIFLTGVYSPYEGNNDEMDSLRLLLENNIRLATLQVFYTLRDLFLKRITLSSGGNYYTGVTTATSAYFDACNSVINLASSPFMVYKEVLEKNVDFTSDSNGSYALANPGPMSLVFQTNIIQNITLTLRSPADENYTPFNKTCNWNLYTYPTYQCKLGVWVVDIDNAEAGTWNYEIQCNSCSEDLTTGQLDLIINPSLTTTEKPTTTTAITTSISISTQDTPVTTTEPPIPSTEIPTSASDSPTITTETSITSTAETSITSTAETSITSTAETSITSTAETSIASTTETSIASTTETSISSTSTITSTKTTMEITSTITSTYLPSTNSETPTTTTTTNLPPTASSETTTTTVNTESSPASTQTTVTVTESPTTIITRSFSESSTTSSPTETSTNPSTSRTADSSSTTSTPSTPTTQSSTFETTTKVSSSSTVSVATPSEATPTEVSPTSPDPTDDTKPFTKSAAFIGGVTGGCILLVILIVLIVVCSKKRSNAGYTDMMGSPPLASTLDERPQTSWKAQTAAYQPYHPTRYDPEVKSTPLSVPNNDGYWNETFEDDGMTLTAL